MKPEYNTFEADVRFVSNEMQKYKRIFLRSIMRRYGFTHFQAELKYMEIMNEALKSVLSHD